MSLTDKLNRLISEVRAAKTAKNDVTRIIETGEALHAAMVLWFKGEQKHGVLHGPLVAFLRALESANMDEGSLADTIADRVQSMRVTLKMYDNHEAMTPAAPIRLRKFLDELPQLKAKK